jgi:hypothetical protein
MTRKSSKEIDHPRSPPTLNPSRVAAEAKKLRLTVIAAKVWVPHPALKIQIYSNLNALTGSNLAAKYAGTRAAIEQIRKPLMQITKTSRGTISAGISENW